jgi:hypothetical protein
VLAEPAEALTDLALGVVIVSLAVRLRRRPAGHGYWLAAFWCFGAAALAGSVHHGVIVRWPQAGHLSWAVVSVVLVVALSYLFAGTVADVLGRERVRAFWLLRGAGLLAYAVMAATGRAGIAAILACESLTMVSVLALWVWAAWRQHPLAPLVLLAMLTSGAAAGIMALDPAQVQVVGLDRTSAYHLAQIVGMVLLYVAVRGGPTEPEHSGEIRMSRARSPA